MKKFQDEDLHAVKQLLMLKNYQTRKEEAKRNHDRQFYPYLNLYKGGRAQSEGVSSRVKEMLKRRSTELRGPEETTTPITIQTEAPDQTSSLVDKLDFIFEKIGDQIQQHHVTSYVYDEIYKIIKILQNEGYLLDKAELEKYAEFTNVLISEMSSPEVMSDATNEHLSDSIILALQRVEELLRVMMTKVNYTKSQRKDIYRSISKDLNKSNFNSALSKITKLTPVTASAPSATEVDDVDEEELDDIEETPLEAFVVDDDASGVEESKEDPAAKVARSRSRKPVHLPFSAKPKSHTRSHDKYFGFKKDDTTAVEVEKDGKTRQVIIPKTREILRAQTDKQELVRLAEALNYHPQKSSDVRTIHNGIIRILQNKIK